MRCYVPGRGVCNAEIEGDYYRLVIPASPGSKLTCVRRVIRDSAALIPLDTIDARAIMERLRSPAPIDWSSPARPRLNAWTAKLQSGMPEEVAEIVADISTKTNRGKSDTERRLLQQAVPLLLDVLRALPPSSFQQEALRMLGDRDAG